MIKPRTIALIFAFLVSLVTSIVLIAFGLLDFSEVVKVAVVVAVVVVVFQYLLVRYGIYTELEKIIETLERISQGDFTLQAPPKQNVVFHPLKKVRRAVYLQATLDRREINQLKRLAAFRKEFIADVSHELKTPLFAAQGFVHTLIDGAAEDEVIRTRFLKKAAKSLDSLDILIQDLLTLSQIEIGEVKMQFEYFEINKMASEIIEQLENKAQSKGIVLELDQVYTEPIIVFADYLKMKQVVVNLVSNGIKYNKEGGEVKIGFLSDKSTVSVFVKDNGEGIPEEDLTRIFERFYRVEKSRSREKGGTGLGLAIVKHIVEGHKSKIIVNSKVGEGSVFTFKLPKGKTDSLFN